MDNYNDVRNDNNGDLKLAIITVTISVIFVILVIGITLGKLKSSYNKLVELDEQTNYYEAELESALQARLETVPDLVKILKAKMTHEENMIDSITDARSKLTTSINSVNDAKEKLSDAIDSNNLDSEIEASEEVSIAIDKLTTVVMEAYPDFSSDTEYQSVMDSIEGAAHRVQVARVDYAASIATYNNEVRKFPNNVIAKLFNFEKKEYLKADDAANNSSMVDLD